jgi:two-component system sensor histidine kinase VicK
MPHKTFLAVIGFITMSISYIPQQGFPFGHNIHFVYSISSEEFLFLHDSMGWILSGSGTGDADKVTSKIDPEDLLYLQDVFSNILARRFSGKITFKLRGPEQVRWLQVTPFIGEYKSDEVITGTLTDVTDEVLNMQSLTKFTDKKNSILHMLGHDLRGPLNIARSLMKTITRQVEDPVMLEKTEHIAGILQQSIDMISDLVKREFLETTDAELVKTRVNIVKLIKDYLEECKRSEALAGLSFELGSSSQKIFIKLDNAKFMQVINNLISNSLKFTPAGGTISVTIEDKGDQVNFRFSDTGIGIPESLLPEIFEKFTAARRPGLQGEPTLGLGLSIVKSIIGWHQGWISCESKEGSGTTFFIRLPKNLPG